MRSSILALALAGLLTPVAPVLADPATGIAAYEREDYQTAYRELQPLAEAGDAAAQWYIARMLHFGHGVTRNVFDAVRWYRLAADQDHPGAMYSLAEIYFEGHLGERDPKESAYWYRLAADHGVADALYRLGYLFDYGWAVPRDQVVAHRWYAQAVAAYRPAAAEGDPRAQYALAEMYRLGKGVAQDMREASRLYHLAAKADFGPAQEELGDWYLPRPSYIPKNPLNPVPDGDILAKDAVEAYKWAALALRNGQSNAQYLIDSAIERMTPEDLAEAKRRVEVWSPRQ